MRGGAPARLLVGLVLAVSGTQALAQTPEERGLAIAREADARDSGFGDWSAVVAMILRDSGGSESRRHMRVGVLEMPGDGDRSLIVFDRPPDIADTALLTHAHKTGDDDQWLYLPAISRVKRISAANKSGPFVGSEFAYEDMISQEVERFTYRYLGDEPCDPFVCFVVERRPVDRSSGYSRQVVWFDQLEYRIQRVDFYDRKEALLKTLVASGYRRHAERFWRADAAAMKNHQSGKSTDLDWSAYRFGGGLQEGDFTQNALTREE